MQSGPERDKEQKCGQQQSQKGVGDSHGFDDIVEYQRGAQKQQHKSDIDCSAGGAKPQRDARESRVPAQLARFRLLASLNLRDVFASESIFM